MSERDNDAIDFNAAEMFLRSARAAHAAGQDADFIAARKMVAVALCIAEAPSEELNAVRMKRRR